MQPLILVGGGGHCRSVIDVVEMQGLYRIEGILDLDLARGEEVCGYPILGGDEEIEKWAQKGAWFLVTVGEIGPAKIRVKLAEKIHTHTDRFATVISPRAYVSKRAKVAKGSVVMHDALINSDAVVGCNSIVNSKALIEHDAVVQKHAHIATGAIVNGGVLLREGSFVGSGAVVVQGAQTSPFAFIKAGSVYKGEA